MPGTAPGGADDLWSELQSRVKATRADQDWERTFWAHYVTIVDWHQRCDRNNEIFTPDELAAASPRTMSVFRGMRGLLDGR